MSYSKTKILGYWKEKYFIVFKLIPIKYMALHPHEHDQVELRGVEFLSTETHPQNSSVDKW